jgi:hypothetical protein
MYCPYCGENNNKQVAFNFYKGGDYICYTCNIEFYFGKTKDIEVEEEESEEEDCKDDSYCDICETHIFECKCD